MKLIKFFFTIIFFSLVFQINTSPVLADEPNQGSYNFKEQSGLSAAATGAGYEINDEKTIESYIGQIINIVLSVLGVIFLILIIYGGILWMTAAGNEEKVKKAKELITEALIGLVIVLAAYAISYFVINQLVNASLTSNTDPQSFDPNP